MLLTPAVMLTFVSASLLLHENTSLATPIRGRCLGLHVTMNGGSGPNVLIGTNHRDVIHGRRGDDTILGLSGDDYVCGGRGSDTINGGDDSDQGRGGPGIDHCINLEQSRSCR